ncbi:MAG: hypothetical protein ACRECL_04125 [Bradyrhizobium sp.]
MASVVVMDASSYARVAAVPVTAKAERRSPSFSPSDEVAEDISVVGAGDAFRKFRRFVVVAAADRIQAANEVEGGWLSVVDNLAGGLRMIALLLPVHLFESINGVPAIRRKVRSQH